jgi:hypothetical protein
LRFEEGQHGPEDVADFEQKFFFFEEVSLFLSLRNFSKSKTFSLVQNFSKQDSNLLLFITRYEKVFLV